MVSRFLKSNLNKLEPGAALKSLNQDFHKQFSRLALTLAIAETSTGGLIADMLTDQPGASAYFMGSVVAYSYPSLQTLIQVKPETLEQHGAVSEATVIEMAQSVRRLFNTDIGIGICGITGPGGGTAQKPVGTTWLAISAGDAVSQTMAYHACFEGDRREIKTQMAHFSLEKLANFLTTLSD